MRRGFPRFKHRPVKASRSKSRSKVKKTASYSGATAASSASKVERFTSRSRPSRKIACVVALLSAAATIGSNLRFFPRMHIPISHAFFPPGFHLAAPLVTGITAGFCEEVLFRAFLMTEFAQAGYGRVMQVLMPGLAFGLSPAGYFNQSFLPWLRIAFPTAFLGMLWGVWDAAAWFRRWSPIS